jgi:hypothetical protein
MVRYVYKSKNIFLQILQFFTKKYNINSTLYVVCIYDAICLQIQEYFPPDPAIFSPKIKILILPYTVFYTDLCKKFQYFMA